MNAKLYKMKCLTNMHVGSGEVNFNIIDNEVERDPITNYPTVNASGIKGALREYCEALSFSQPDMDQIFGKGNTKGNTSNMYAGRVKFFSANMLAIPMRVSKGQVPFALVTTETALAQLTHMCEALSYPYTIQTLSPEDIYIEDILCQKRVMVFDEIFYVMAEEDFRKISLPVISRQCVEPGHENFWYEEVVPHETVLFFFALSSDNSLDTLHAALTEHPIVQFGSNASIGYGFCKVEEVPHE